MLELDVIEEPKSAFAASILFIPKKDGEIRFCVDYQSLNSVTVPDAFQMPRTDDLKKGWVKQSFYLC